MLLSTVVFIFGCSENTQRLIVSNNTPKNLTYKEVVLNRSDLNAEVDKLPFIKDQAGENIPCQLDDMDGDDQWDELIFQVSILAKDQAAYSVNWTDAANYPKFTKNTQVHLGFSKARDDQFESVADHVRLQGHVQQQTPYTYRYEGPGWESNLVAFRSYFDTRNGKDIFGKTTTELVTDKIVKDYHALKDWGLDILKVGNSLGAGALAILKEDSLIRLGATETARFKKITEGPVRSVFVLEYEGWDVLGENYSLKETISIWANMRWYKSQVVLMPKNNDILVTGIVNLKDAEVGQLNHAGFDGLYTHGTQSEIGDNLGMGLIIPEGGSSGFSKAPATGDGITSTELAYLSAVSNQYTFYFYVGWESENANFGEKTYFETMLKETAEEIGSGLEVKFD